MTQRALLVGCGEPGIRAALEALEGDRLAGHEVERILAPGGCWWLAEAANASSGRLKRIVASRSSAFEGVAAVLADASLARVLLTAHQECTWYRRQLPNTGPGDLVRRMGADMYAARDEAQRLAKRPLAVSGAVLTRDATGAWQARELF